MPQVEQELIARFSSPVPRYTSYPTAPHFSTAIGNADYADWLQVLPAGVELSLYVHIPYCHALCWYCGCNTKAVQRYDPVARYLDVLEAEIRNVSTLVPPTHRVAHVHWGGGSPNILTAAHIRRLADCLHAGFHVPGGAEFAVEIDPRHLGQNQVDALAAAGLTRISIGVQDFDPIVQRAINRQQTFEGTRRAVAMFRERGVHSTNIDLVYGLPNQTLDTLAKTIERVVRLAPDRIAAFGYAHLPARFKHQQLIDGRALPGSRARYEMAELIADRLVAAGYVRVGLDHFALPSDPLAQRPVARNFQGYTTDGATALVGLGASAIGRLDGGYVQNATPVGDYIRRIHDQGLAVVRGLALTTDDRVRAFAIERLMCGLEFSRNDLESRFGAGARPLMREAETLIATDRHGLVERTVDGFRVTERGRPFLRSLCAAFDAHLRAGAATHASGI